MYHEFKALEIYISIFQLYLRRNRIVSTEHFKIFELSNLSQIRYNSYHNDLPPTGSGLIKL